MKAENEPAEKTSFSILFKMLGVRYQSEMGYVRVSPEWVIWRPLTRLYKTFPSIALTLSAILVECGRLKEGGRLR